MDNQEQDVLTPIVSKVFATMGQDASDPAIRNEVAKTIVRLRTINPGVSDADLAVNIKSNLPATIGAVAQSKRIDSGTDEQAELQRYKQQLEKDAADARGRGSRAYGAFSPVNPVGNEAFFKQQQEQAFLPSQTVKKQIEGNAAFYDNQNKRAVAQRAEEEAQQAGIKTQSDRAKFINEQTMNDAGSVISKSVRDALSVQLKQMGVPANVIAQMAGMNVMQMRTLAESFTKTEQDRANIQKTFQEAATGKALAAAHYAQANASNAQAGESRARTEGVNLENRQKAVITKGYEDAASNATQGWGNAIPEVRDKLMPPAARANEDANNKKLDELTATANERQQARQLIQETRELLSKTGGLLSGPGLTAYATKYTNADIQKLEKNLAALRAMEIGGQKFASGGDAASGAMPDATKQRSVILSGLARVEAQLDRSDIMAAELNRARQTGSLANADQNWISRNTRSFAVVDENGNAVVKTFTPLQIKNGAFEKLQEQSKGKKVFPLLEE